MYKTDDKFYKLLEEYSEDIRKFGFEDYAIDFSDLSTKKIKYICEAMRKYNQEHTITKRISNILNKKVL